MAKTPYVRALAEHLAARVQTALLTGAYIELLYQSAPLHDIGKVGIPDAILAIEAGFLAIAAQYADKDE